MLPYSIWCKSVTTTKQLKKTHTHHKTHTQQTHHITHSNPIWVYANTSHKLSACVRLHVRAVPCTRNACSQSLINIPLVVCNAITIAEATTAKAGNKHTHTNKHMHWQNKLHVPGTGAEPNNLLQRRRERIAFGETGLLAAATQDARAQVQPPSPSRRHRCLPGGNMRPVVRTERTRNSQRCSVPVCSIYESLSRPTLRILQHCVYIMFV